MNEPDEIEILDVAAEPTAAETESVATISSSRWIPVAVVLALALGVAALATAGGNDAAAPSTTTEPTPSVTVSTPTTTQPTSRSVQPLFAVGDGPSVEWQRVDVDTAATEFRWFDDGFLGLESDGSAVLIRPNDAGGSITSLVGADTDTPVRSSEPVIGEPADNPALLRFLGGPEIPIEPMPAPPSDIVSQQIRVATTRIGDRVLVHQSTTWVLDIDEFRRRSGATIGTIFGIEVRSTQLILTGLTTEENITIADTALTGADIEALEQLETPINRLSLSIDGGQAQPVTIDMPWIDWIASIGDEFVVGGALVLRSGDGVTWEETSDETPRFGGVGSPGPDGVLAGLDFEQDAGFLTLSTDAGRAWNRFGRPLDDPWQITSASPLIALTGWQGAPRPSTLSPLVLLTAEWRLSIEEASNTFELARRNGAVVLSGPTDDPATGFRYAPGSQDIWFVDPTTGDELARIPLISLASAVASARTNEGDPQLLAIADRSVLTDGVIEWSVTPITQLFGPDALAAEIIAGEGWLLADVTTAEGRQLHTAQITTG